MAPTALPSVPSSRRWLTLAALNSGSEQAPSPVEAYHDLGTLHGVEGLHIGVLIDDCGSRKGR